MTSLNKTSNTNLLFGLMLILFIVLALAALFLFKGPAPEPFKAVDYSLLPLKTKIFVQDDNSIIMEDLFKVPTPPGALLTSKSYQISPPLNDLKYTFRDPSCFVDNKISPCGGHTVVLEDKEKKQKIETKYQMRIAKESKLDAKKEHSIKIQLTVDGAITERKKNGKTSSKELVWQFMGSRNWRINGLETNVTLPPKIFQYVKPEDMKDIDIDFSASLYRMEKGELELIKEFKRKDIDDNNPETKALRYSFLEDKSLNIKYSDIIDTNERLFLSVSWLPNAVWYR